MVDSVMLTFVASPLLFACSLGLFSFAVFIGVMSLLEWVLSRFDVR